jgi:preprotein translocase subunit SecG
MTFFLIFLHILVSIALISIVLLQSGKGAEMGASFGASGSQSVFGAGGGNTFMSKLTTGAAIIFMLTSLTLAYRSGHTGTSSIMSGKAAQTAPAQKAAAPAAPAQTPAATPQQQTAPAAQPAAPAPMKK